MHISLKNLPLLIFGVFLSGIAVASISIPPKIEVVNSPSEEKPFSNPILIYGSSFGNYFQSLYKIGKFDEMLHFTSSTSLNKFGVQEILNAYRTMEFAYEIKLKSKVDNADNTITLNYLTNIMATKGLLRMNVVMENDSVKVLLNNVTTKNPFTTE